MFSQLCILFIVAHGVCGLTCYNGMKMLSMQSMGDTTEECSGNAYCYTMRTSALMLVEVVKAGCSTWRCMFARDTCISMSFQAVPVSLCCCSTDRCNGAGGGQSAITNQQTNTNGDQNRDNQNEKSSWGTSWSAPSKDSPSTPQPTTKWTKQQLEEKFRDFDVDHRTDDDRGVEEEFVKVDVRSTTPSTRGARPQPPARGAEVTIP